MPVRERLTECFCGQPIDSAGRGTPTHCLRCGRTVDRRSGFRAGSSAPLGRSLSRSATDRSAA
jgi:tRNA(Ile2) C34 agmatinyltransferase TiaS